MFALKPAHILLGTIAISGCTSSYTVDCEGIPKKNHLTCSEVQRRIGESNATIVFEDGGASKRTVSQSPPTRPGFIGVSAAGTPPLRRSRSGRLR